MFRKLRGLLDIHLDVLVDTYVANRVSSDERDALDLQSLYWRVEGFAYPMGFLFLKRKHMRWVREAMTK